MNFIYIIIVSKNQPQGQIMQMVSQQNAFIGVFGFFVALVFGLGFFAKLKNSLRLCHAFIIILFLEIFIQIGFVANDIKLFSPETEIVALVASILFNIFILYTNYNIAVEIESKF